jgi:ribonuclease HI
VKAMKTVSLITDGSCLGNPGPGGWACILRFGAVSKELFGYDPQTTNNRMELMAAIQGLLALKEPCDVEVTTDALYVSRRMTTGLERWRRRGWWMRTRPLPNADLWIELDGLTEFHRVTWIWTKGHAVHTDNNRCDWLAQNAARTQTSSFADGSRHAPFRFVSGSGYVPPRPQASLFEELDDDEEDDVE